MTRKLINLALFLSGLCLFGITAFNSPARADDRTMIAAATANAVDALRDDVASARIDSELTVADFLAETHGTDDLMELLGRAEQVGGARFSSDGAACEIQLQISGERVARELVTIAANHPRHSPVPAEALARMLERWTDREFTGTGSSISGLKVQFIRPPATPDDAWGDVTDQARQQAVDAARDDAITRALDEIRPIPWASGKTLGEEQSIAPFKDALSTWLSARPVRRVWFRSDHQVELTLSTPPTEYCNEVLTAAHAAFLPLPNPGEEATLRGKFAALPTVSIGVATAYTSAPSTAAFVPVIPSQPPSWLDEPLMGEGTANSRGNKLKTARVAEAASIEALRTTINALPLDGAITIGEAAHKSPAVAQAVARCLSRARPYKVEYRADGSVSVKSSLDPRELWAEISQQ
jgi:hypothetical protein